MPAPSQILPFVLASFVLCVTPGPGVTYIVTRGLTQGRRAGLGSVVGVALGNALSATLAALGLAAVLAASATAFHLVKYAGAAHLMDEKAALARETFALTGVEHVVDFIHGDARDHLDGAGDIAFCFLDAEKEVYSECYEAVVPRLVSGGLLVADSAINHAPTLQAMLDRALSDDRVDALIVPIANGELVCRKR